MDSASLNQIIRDHGPLLQSKATTAKQLNIVNVKHLPTPVKRSQTIHFEDAANFEASGPPSPLSGPLRNFGVVCTGIYRSALPSVCNLEHVKSLNIRTVITLVETALDPQVIGYFQTARINHYRVPIPSHHNGASINVQDIAKVLRVMTNPCNFPILVHCNKGKHRTGCIVACFRKFAELNDRDDWMKRISPVDEYRLFSTPKCRAADEAFIRSFEASNIHTAFANRLSRALPLDNHQHRILYLSPKEVRAEPVCTPEKSKTSSISLSTVAMTPTLSTSGSSTDSFDQSSYAATRGSTISGGSSSDSSSKGTSLCASPPPECSEPQKSLFTTKPLVLTAEPMPAPRQHNSYSPFDIFEEGANVHCGLRRGLNAVLDQGFPFYKDNDRFSLFDHDWEDGCVYD